LPARIQGAKTVSEVPAVDARVEPAVSPAREGRNAPTQSAEPLASSLGYVQKADGKVETVLADGDTVRLVPETATLAEVASPKLSTQILTAADATVSSNPWATGDDSFRAGRSSGSALTSAILPASFRVPTAEPSGADMSAPGQPAVHSAAIPPGMMEGTSDPAALSAEPAGRPTDGLSNLAVEIKPMGFVVTGDGELAAILSSDDGISIVRQGDRFAGRYRALSVSADAVEAVEEPPRQPVTSPLSEPRASPDLLMAAQRGPPLYPDPGTFIFQTLGYVQTQDGDIQGIVAEG